MTSSTSPPPPSHLSARASTLWRETLAAYELAGHELEVLRLALEAMDRAATARRMLRREGITTVNRFGDAVAHPAVKIEKDSAAACARLFSQLDLPEPLGVPQAPASPARLREVS